MSMLTAIIRSPSRSMDRCEVTFKQRSAIDPERLHAQHEAYREELAALGCAVIVLPAEENLPDAVFVEDMAVVLDEVAILTRCGAESRRAELESIAAALAPLRPLLSIVEPGTLDGGDVLVLGRTIHVGQSTRTNAAGVTQLRELVAQHGYEVRLVAIGACLHLKSAVSAVSEDTLLIQPEWVDAAAFEGMRVIKIDASEPDAANALCIGNSVIHASNFVRTRARLEAAGLRVRSLDLTEIQKAEGAATCCSLVFRSLPHQWRS